MFEINDKEEINQICFHCDLSSVSQKKLAFLKFLSEITAL